MWKNYSIIIQTIKEKIDQCFKEPSLTTITPDIEIDIIFDNEEAYLKECHGQRRHHIGIFRGMLRYITLIMLKEKPMSGSEISEEIESYLDWKPSPGSIYPLLGNLQEEDLIKPNENSDPTLKRFLLTEKGLSELETHSHHDIEIRNRSKNIKKLYWRLLRGMPEEAFGSYIALQDQIEETYGKLTNLEQFKAILEDTTKELKKLEKKENE